MPGPSAYSPLETLLLFLHLKAYGINATVFTKVSEHIKNEPLVRQSAAFDPGRLSPEALREFFLRIWKEESRSEAKPTIDSDAHNGLPPHSPRKRKAPSPSLPTIQDVTQNIDLLPKLVLRLYARYRDQAVSNVREHERRHAKLQEEIDEIERGDWDARLQKELDEMRRQQAPQQSRLNGDHKSTPAVGQSLSAENKTREGANVHPSSPKPVTIDLPKTVPRHGQPVLPNSSTPAQSTTHIPPPLAPAYRGTPPHQAPNSYPQRSGLQSERTAGSLNSQQTTTPRPTQPSQSLPGAKVGSLPSKRVGSGPMATVQSQFPPNPYNSLQASSPGPTATPTPPTYPNSPRPNPQTQHASSPNPSQRGGVMLQPWQVSPQVPTPIHQVPAVAQPNQPAQIQPKSTVPSRQTTTPASVSTPLSSRGRAAPSPLVLTIARQLSNPSLNGTFQRTPSRSGRLGETRWKDTPPGSVPVSPTRPRSRSVSPISDKEPSPEPEPERASKGRGRRHKGVSRELSVPDNGPPSTRSGRTTRKTRGNSVASSAPGSSIRGRSRSPSSASENESIQRKLKVDPSTPAETSDMSMADFTPLPAGKLTRQTRSTKRKRSVAATSEISEDIDENVDFPEPQIPQPVERESILAVRNFSRLSQTVMNDITSHKHASTFSAPVRDRDAEGYSSMIRRPTDLKSIRVAISAGARVVNASPLDSSASSGTLAWSEELIPPKGIVNSGQLERELMRMFANAVMFSPGEDGVVADAREMFESAEVSLVNFRSAEQTSDAASARKRGESEMSPSQEEESSTPITTGKRRKLG